jgi:hypothetical protein
MKKILFVWLGLLTVLVAVLAAQGSGNPSQLRVLLDATGALYTSVVAQTLPLSQPITFNQARLRTDATGALVTASASGATAGSISTRRTGFIQADPSTNFTIAAGEIVGIQGCTGTGANADVSTTSTIFTNFLTTTSIDSSASMLCNAWAWPDHLPTFIMKFKTGPSNAVMRLWAGWTNAGAISTLNTDDPSTANVKMIAFRFATTPDTQFVGYVSTGSGSLKTVSSNVNAIAVSTEYLLKIVVNSTSSVSFTINGGTAQTVTTNIPNGSGLKPFFAIITNETVQKRLDFSRFYVEAN